MSRWCRAPADAVGRLDDEAFANAQCLVGIWLPLFASRWSRWFCPSTLTTASIPATALERRAARRPLREWAAVLNSGLARLSWAFMGTAHREAQGGVVALTISALGVVFGDIGTSPLYALKECVSPEHGFVQNRSDLLGVLSLIFWSLMLVVTFKYLMFVMRAHNRGEGGIFALLALMPERMRSPDGVRIGGIALLALLGAALLCGEGVITPAISVLSAVEGLEVATPAFRSAVVPITCALLVGLFAIQRYGTGAVGRCFGPIMLLWFGTLAGLGAWHASAHPEILSALSPHHAARFFSEHGWGGGLVLGSVVLAVTGVEALSADMGHFGVGPIRIAWSALVLPALVLAYFGQGAVLLSDPTATENPFFAMVPRGPWTVALVLLAGTATVIASQALISGAFSLIRQAVQLGYFPRVEIRHTSPHTEGQIYVPAVNWGLAVGCLLLVVTLQESSRLAAAYGVAVTGTMTATSIAFYAVARHTWGWPRATALPMLVLLLAIDLPFLGANLIKFSHGGYIPVLIGVGLLAIMLVWRKGHALVAQYHRRCPELTEFLSGLKPQMAIRVPGCGSVPHRAGFDRAGHLAPPRQAQPRAARDCDATHDQDGARPDRRGKPPLGASRRVEGLLPRDRALRLHGGARRRRASPRDRGQA